MTRALAVVLVALAIVACGGGDTPLSPAEARKISRGAVLTATDIGPSWHRSPPQSKSPSGALDINNCTGGIDLAADAVAPGTPFTFVTGTDPTTLALVSGVTTVLQPKTSDRLFRFLRSDAFRSCLLDMASSGAVEGGTFDTGRAIFDKADVPQADRAVHVVLPFTSDIHQSTGTAADSSTSSTPVSGEFVLDLFGSGQVVTVLAVLNIGGVVPASDVTRWTTALARRQKL